MCRESSREFEREISKREFERDLREKERSQKERSHRESTTREELVSFLVLVERSDSFVVTGI
jgi:hypothetical protein